MSAPVPAKPAANKSARYDALRKTLHDLSLPCGSRLLYVELDDCAGPDGQCFIHEATLAKRLGLSPTNGLKNGARCIRKWLSPLVKAGHVIAKRTGRGSRYTLSWVGISDRNERSAQGDFRAEQMFRSERNGRSSASYPQSLSVGVQPQAPSSSSRPHTHGRKDDDDDPISLKRERNNPVRQVLLAWVQRSNFARPSGQIPDALISQRLQQAGATVRDLADFLHHDYIDHLVNPPATWKHVSTSVLRWLGMRHFRASSDTASIAAEIRAQRRRANARQN